MAIAIHTPKDLGAAVRQGRRDLGWSQQELARQAEVSRPWISELEHGKRTAEVGLVLRVLFTLNLTVTITPRPPVKPGTHVDLDDDSELI